MLLQQFAIMTQLYDWLKVLSHLSGAVYLWPASHVADKSLPSPSNNTFVKLCNKSGEGELKKGPESVGIANFDDRMVMTRWWQWN